MAGSEPAKSASLSSVSSLGRIIVVCRQKKLEYWKSESVIHMPSFCRKQLAAAHQYYDQHEFN